MRIFYAVAAYLAIGGLLHSILSLFTVAHFWVWAWFFLWPLILLVIGLLGAFTLFVVLALALKLADQI